MEWIGREGLAPETHEEYLNDFINHFYKNVLKLVDRAMRKEDTSAQGKIVTEILQHSHACINSVRVFYGRVDELETLQTYITDDNNQPFVLFGAGLVLALLYLFTEWLFRHYDIFNITTSQTFNNKRELETVRGRIMIDNSVKARAIKLWTKSVLDVYGMQAIPYNIQKHIEQLNTEVINSLNKKLSLEGEHLNKRYNLNVAES